MPIPNLFAYATSELSPDAFFCWLLDWANKENGDGDPALQQAACSFLNALLAKHHKPRVAAPEVKIYRQSERADIVAVVNGRFVLAIEDKIRAGVHGDQLHRYPDSIGKKFPNAEILPIFLKTVEQSSYRDVEQANYKLFLRSDILAALRPAANGVSNAIFVDFLRNLEKLEASITSYRKAPIGEWIRRVGPLDRLLQRAPAAAQ
jgi:PD-(D/E)XK nuclease superfamily